MAWDEQMEILVDTYLQAQVSPLYASKKPLYGSQSWGLQVYDVYGKYTPQVLTKATKPFIRQPGLLLSI
jgi:hypothetical protein